MRPLNRFPRVYLGSALSHMMHDAPQKLLVFSSNRNIRHGGFFPFRGSGIETDDCAASNAECTRCELCNEDLQRRMRVRGLLLMFSSLARIHRIGAFCNRNVPRHGGGKLSMSTSQTAVDLERVAGDSVGGGGATLVPKVCPVPITRFGAGVIRCNLFCCLRCWCHAESGVNYIRSALLGSASSQLAS